MATKFSPDTKAAIRKYGPRVNKLARSKYGIGGKKLLSKLVAGESGDDPNAVSSAGARGRTQFMPETREALMRKFRIDPWRSADEAVHGAVIHLKGKLGHAKGLEGYNPGDPDYPEYILSRQVKVPRGGRRGPGGPAPPTPEMGNGGKLLGSFTTKSTDYDALLLDSLTERKSGMSLLDDVSERLQSGVYDSEAVTKLTSAMQGQDPGGKTIGTAKQGGKGFVKEANLIDRKNRAGKLPYKWGGGHQAKQVPRGSKVVPLDCSGAVSRVLGIDPRVSGQFEKWGKPGKGRVTIYANSKHVLMHIRGKGFFGTSGANPGGGAGWIPDSAVSKEYLSQFTVRHTD